MASALLSILLFSTFLSDPHGLGIFPSHIHPQTVLQGHVLPLADSRPLQKPSPLRSAPLSSSELCFQTRGPLRHLPCHIHAALRPPPLSDPTPLLDLPPSSDLHPSRGSAPCLRNCATHLDPPRLSDPPPRSDPRPRPASASARAHAPHQGRLPLRSVPSPGLSLSQTSPSPGCAWQRPSASAARKGWAPAAGRRTPGGAPWAAAARRFRRPRPAPWPPLPPLPRIGSWPSRASGWTEGTDAAQERAPPARLCRSLPGVPVTGAASGPLRRRQLPRRRLTAPRPSDAGSIPGALAPPFRYLARPLWYHSSVHLEVNVFPSEQYVQ